MESVKRKHYRITLFPGSAATICKELVVLAALSNGEFSDENKVSLQGLEQNFKAEKMKYPSTNEDLVISVIENKLIVDKVSPDIKLPNKCLLEIEEVEIVELKETDPDLTYQRPNSL